MAFIERIKNISLKKIVVNNFWLKVIALLMAIIIWLYVNGELTKGITV